MTKEEIEKIKQSQFVKDVLKPIEDIIKNVEAAGKELTDYNSLYNKIARGEEI